MKNPSLKVKGLLLAAVTIATGSSTGSLMNLVAAEIPVQHIKVADGTETTGWKGIVRKDSLDKVEKSLMLMVQREISVDTQKVASPGTDTTGWKSV